MNTSTPKLVTPRVKTVAEPTRCKCAVPGCDSFSKRNFAPGHDAKLIGYLTREVVAGNMTLADASDLLSTRSNGSKLLLSKLGAAVPREFAKIEAKAAKDADKAERKARAAKKSEFAKEQAAAVKADREALATA